MIGLSIESSVGDIKTMIVNGRTRTPEEIADLAMMRVMRIALTAHPEISAQAHEFRERIKTVIAAHIREAMREERSACAMMVQQWNADLADAIRSR